MRTIHYMLVKGIITPLGEVVVSVDLDFAARHGGYRAVAVMMVSDAAVNAQTPGRNAAGHSTMVIDGETVTVTKSREMFAGVELQHYLVSSDPDAPSVIDGEVDLRNETRH